MIFPTETIMELSRQKDAAIAERDEAQRSLSEHSRALLSVEARLAEAEEKRVEQLRQQGTAWAADVAQIQARLAKAVNLLCLARSSLGPAKGLAADIDAFLATREVKHDGVTCGPAPNPCPVCYPSAAREDKP